MHENPETGRAALVAAYLRGLAPAPLPEALAGPERLLGRARLLARLTSLRDTSHRGEQPLLLAGIAGPGAAAVALLALTAWSWSWLAERAGAREGFGMLTLLGLPQLVALALASGLVLAVAIVLPLVLSEE